MRNKQIKWYTVELHGYCVTPGPILSHANAPIAQTTIGSTTFFTCNDGALHFLNAFPKLFIS